MSYDGACGGKTYGRDLPKRLGCGKFLLNAGKSTQQTLLGGSAITYESLYVSAGLLGAVLYKAEYGQIRRKAAS